MHIQIPALSADTPVRAVILDFDGTVSTLRCGWERVMEALMVRHLAPNGASDELRAEIRAYIDESTGIQTIYQMEWLADQVTKRTGVVRDAWSYKDEYNEMLLRTVNDRIAHLSDGTADPADYLIAGSKEYLELLAARGIGIYIASGTDDVDLQREAALLGIAPIVTRIQGAPHRQKSCSKEAVLRQLLRDGGFSGTELMVIGDGKVEIQLGAAAGAYTVGLATREDNSGEMDEMKRVRLQKAGASILAPDFRPLIDAWHNQLSV